MSEEKVQYNTSNDDFDLEKHIEQEIIKGSYDRLRLVLEYYKDTAENEIRNLDIKEYIQIESLNLELARFVLDYLMLKNDNSHE